MPEQIAPIITGQVKFVCRLDFVAFRQAIAGPIPVRTKSESASGASILLKNGGPTIIRVPMMSSLAVGKSVHQRMMKAVPTRTILFTTKADSFERMDSKIVALLSAALRFQIQKPLKTMVRIRNPKK